MNAYASNSKNPYARKYLTKGRRSSDNFGFLDGKSYLLEPKIKKIKCNNNDIEFKQHCIKSEPYNFFNDANEMQNDFNEFYEFDRSQTITAENYNYLNYNENQNISDENSVFMDDSLEEYSIDFIDETDNSIIENLSCEQYYDPPLYNGTLFGSRRSSQQSQSKRKQGIVGRPTLSSPQRLLVPDNVYYHDRVVDKCFTDINHRVKSPAKPRNISRKRDSDDVSLRGTGRSRPRILLKPAVSEPRIITEHLYRYSVIEQDARDVEQRQVANREFARNLVARAQRQGTVIDKNKIPLSVFDLEDSGSASDQRCLDRISTVAEIRESEEHLLQPYTTTISIADLRKPSPPMEIIVKKPQIPVRLTASDILKQKWKAANCN